MGKVIRSNGKNQAVDRTARSGFESDINLEPEWVMESRKLDPRFAAMVKAGIFNEDGSTREHKRKR